MHFGGNIWTILCRICRDFPYLVRVFTRHEGTGMPRPSALLSATLAMALGCSLVLAQDLGSPVADTIAARRGLMNQLTSLQTLVDARLAASEYSPELYDLGQSVASSLEAFAMLLPADTNLLGGAPAREGISTTAAAEIWSDLPAFQKLLRDTAAQARIASETDGIGEFKVEWDKVTQSCTSCHEAYVSYDPFAGL